MTTKEYILAILKSNKPKLVNSGIRDVGLFGSYVRSEQKYDSDIDVLLDFELGKESFDNYMETCELLETLFENEKIEIVTINGLSPYMGPIILNEVVYV